MRLFLQGLAILVVSGFVVVKLGATLCAPLTFLSLSCFSAVLAVPAVITSYRQDPQQPVARLIVLTAAGASVRVWLVLALSLALLNFVIDSGAAILPAVGVFIWGVALSFTAAASASALLALVSRASFSAAKWGFRVAILVAIMFYQRYSLTWSTFWFDQVDRWGLSPVAFGSWLLVAATGWLSYRALTRGQVKLVS